MKSSTRVVSSTFGVIVGLAGLEHGIGEILQGSVAPASIMIQSWPDSDFMRILAGEPAMTILPNLLLTGILAVLLSLLMIGWALALVPRRYGGWGMILISILMLLFGGGLGPPLMGIMLGAAATRIHKPLSWWRVKKNRAGRAKKADARPPLLARAWRPALIASVLGYLALLPGMPLASRYLGAISDNLVYASGLFAFGSLILAIFAALAWDSYHSRPMRT